jgi:hypothetical protein
MVFPIMAESQVSFGLQLRQRRKNLDITQPELAT